jgi:methylated-DNA-[protein]-cysteine S-methyltransferase
MEYRFYTTFSSPFDNFTIVWEEIGRKEQIIRIFLSDPKLKSEIKALNSFNQIMVKSTSSITVLGNKIQQFFQGENVKFDMEFIDFSVCYEFQRRVLFAESSIPKGWISTYKRIANHLRIPSGARVVGKALAKNPFPIVVPCHRATKTNGDLGGFQEGINMKRALLEMEGIEFSERGKVITDRIYY